MDRPIAYDKLAREDRFVRMRTRDVATVMKVVSRRLFDFSHLSSSQGQELIFPKAPRCDPYREALLVNTTTNPLE